MSRPDLHQLIYSSKARKWNKKQIYRIFSDRLEFYFKIFIRKDFVIMPEDIVDIWVGKPPAMAELWRGRHPIAGSPMALKFDLADIYEHVVILRPKRCGWPRAIHFTPDNPHEFVDIVKKTFELSFPD